MADYTVDSTLVVNLNDPTNVVEAVIADEVIDAGMPVYLSGTEIDKKVKKANAATSAATAKVRGIALNSALAVGQPIQILKRGKYAPGFTGAASAIIILSATSGKLCPPADLASSSRAQVIGVMPAASQLTVDFISTAFYSAAAKP